MQTRSMVAAALVLLASTAGAAERTVTLEVERMNCASCPYIVDKALERVEGVAGATVSYEQRTAVVRFDDARTSTDALTRATAAAGYPSELEE
ncbi:MAG: mercury resistance system periplasmic binding protein MerP [Halofilum sp. (in: g-proteobacteria)]|nr:mercury resistance system periplasmic binding protein MerP [Halofilum sp. (in: g-proteobacteria)]